MQRGLVGKRKREVSVGSGKGSLGSKYPVVAGGRRTGPGENVLRRGRLLCFPIFTLPPFLFPAE